MKSHLGILFFCIFFMSCSTLFLDPAESEDIFSPELQGFRTKSTSPDVEIDTARIMHFVQTDHRVILLRHIVKRDSVYVQSFTPEDMATFRITTEEQEWANAYIVHLNELLKEQ